MPLPKSTKSLNQWGCVFPDGWSSCQGWHATWSQHTRYASSRNIWMLPCSYYQLWTFQKDLDLVWYKGLAVNHFIWLYQRCGQRPLRFWRESMRSEPLRSIRWIRPSSSAGQRSTATIWSSTSSSREEVSRALSPTAIICNHIWMQTFGFYYRARQERTPVFLCLSSWWQETKWA